MQLNAVFFMLFLSYLGNVFCNAFKLQLFSLHGDINNNLTIYLEMLHNNE